MTIDIRKSQIEGRDFQAEVEAYREGIIVSRATPGMSPPLAGQFVEAALRQVRRTDGGPDDLIIDYQIIDDTPPPPSLAERKAKAIAESRQQEQDEISALVPPGKQRLLAMDHSRAAQSVHAAKVKGTEPPAEAQRIVDEFASIQKRIAEIQYAAAQREAAIEDMVD